MSLEQTIDNLQIRNANMVTFVGTSNTMVDTTTGRIQTKGIQHNSNVITDVSGPHGRGVATLKKYPEIAFEKGKFDSNPTTNTFVQAGYTVTASSQLTGSTHDPWHAFDNTLSGNEGWITDSPRYNSSSPGEAQSGLGAIQFPAASGRYGEYIDLQLPSKIRVKHFIIKTRPAVASWEPEASPGAGYLYGSINGTDWTEIKAFSGLTYGGMGTDGGTQETVQVDSTTPYNYLRFQVTHRAGQNSTDQYAAVGELEFYGYEEDPPAGDHSVDTTFKSRFNNPQTTGVQVLVDGATGVGTNQISGGPDPSGNQSTYVTDGKYWTLNGTLTSNLAVEANTFLEGDQPHAVSVWFNSSNLAANVSNTCVFSISDQEKLDSVNLDLQSNTWHNLTYAYQGEGGSRVTYLDGRKVAEDQAEDTFGDYPPFAMTGYSQSGYVVSASSEYIPTPQYRAWEAFNDITASDYDNWTSGDFYAANGGDGTRSTVTWSGSTNHNGEFIKLELPHKLIVNYVKFEGRQGSGVERQLPRAFTIIGSNDDVNWETIHQETRTTNPSTGETHAMTGVSKHKGFKYIALVPKNSGTTNTNTHISIGNISYYGHRENDLVRLPDPTNVLKYPHIAMTGPAQRGYVASSNNEYTPDGRLAWKAYDGIDTDGSTNIDAWMTHDPSWTTATPGEPIGTGDLAPDTFTVAGVNYTGHWNKLELPHKIRVSQIYMSSRMSTRLPYKGVFLGSDDDSSWEVIYSFNNTLTWSVVSGVGQATTITGITNTNSYKYVMLVVQQINGSDDRLWLNEIKYYGTGVDSIPIQIGGGNIDKVANFRVYDTFIDEYQALEIWNAQKEEFGRAKPQMVLQQGKLGIGTDAPQGSLSVADEPHNLEEFPPRAMTGYKTYMEGHGEFCVSASSYYGTYYPWGAFDRNITDTASEQAVWHTTADFTNATPGIYNAGASLGEYTGAWLKLKLPYSIKPSKVSIHPRTYPDGTSNYDQNPKDFLILGSKDDNTWDVLSTQVGVVFGATWKDFTLSPGNNTYNYFAISCTKIKHGQYFAINDMKYFGTRDQGQSILHDGQLTLTKNLNVPRIGPPLDADDTPRRDRLVVEYNTSTNPTFEGAVRDTSGRGLDGIMHTATYNAVEKAIESNGNTGTSNNGPGGSASGNLNDYGSFETVLPSSFQGNPVFTVSGWFKQNSIAHLQLAWLVARNLRVSANPGLSNKMHWLGITSTGRPRIALGGGGNLNLYYTDGSIKAGIWYHMVVVIEPTGTDVTQNHVRFYLDGVLQTTSNSGSSGTIDLGDGAPPRMHWFWQEASDVYYDGSASNLKIHECALTAEEVKTLYDMGRNGSVANPQPLHIAAPLYAPGASIQTVAENVHDIVTYSSATSRTIHPLTINIKPRFANSKILLQWMINIELIENNVFVIYRNGTKIGYNTSITDAAWVGAMSAAYDVDVNSTVENMYLAWIDAPNTTDRLEYSIVVKSASSSSWPVYLNRTAGSGETGQQDYERTVSFKCATEIAQ